MIREGDTVRIDVPDSCPLSRAGDGNTVAHDATYQTLDAAGEGRRGIVIGVLSDTHIPHRLAALPPAIPAIFAAASVALILHAGDVDEPGALDTLSTVAPVIAVRGNLHLASRSRSSPHLPYAASLDIMGQRVVLTPGTVAPISGSGISGAASSSKRPPPPRATPSTRSY